MIFFNNCVTMSAIENGHRLATLLQAGGPAVQVIEPAVAAAGAWSIRRVTHDAATPSSAGSGNCGKARPPAQARFTYSWKT